MRHSGEIQIRATALEPLHHGGGTSGNTSLLRMQDVILPSGERTRVPFVSGNSIKHRIRIRAAKHALQVLDVPDRALSKGAVDLLFSGGRLSKTEASAFDLHIARRLEELTPWISVCGCSAGNQIFASKLLVSPLHVVCEENAWRLPADLRDSPHLSLRSGAVRTEAFGTRHDVRRMPDLARYIDAPEGDKVPDSTQMLYDLHCVAAGATFWGSIMYRDATDAEIAALSSAFLGDDFHVGGKSSVGFGAIRADVTGIPADAAAIAAYDAGLRERRDEILAFLEEIP